LAFVFCNAISVSISDVDFYGANGTKLGDEAVGLINPWSGVGPDSGNSTGPRTATLNFTPPPGTASVVVWIWTDQGSADLWVTDVTVRDAG